MVEEQVVQAQGLLLTLAVIAAVGSTYPYLCIMSAGLLMIIFTIRSLQDSPSGFLMVVQAVVSTVFAVLGGGCFPYLILYECRFTGFGWRRIFLPPLAYFAGWVLLGKEDFPWALCNVFFLIGITGAIYLAERAAAGVFLTKSRVSQAVSITAVSEMYEKKLNKELVIKNYLAEKNARLEERENISRNIHNSVGHSITAAYLALDAADMLFDMDPVRAREKMNAAKSRVHDSLDSIRRAVRVLDSENEFISMGDFVQELAGVCDNFAMDTRIRIYMDFADVFILFLTADSGHIRLEVSDNGSSDFAEENQDRRIEDGFGLKKLYSYVKRCGGTVSFTNDNGFRTEITMPFG